MSAKQVDIYIAYREHYIHLFGGYFQETGVTNLMYRKYRNYKEYECFSYQNPTTGALLAQIYDKTVYQLIAVKFNLYDSWNVFQVLVYLGKETFKEINGSK